MPDNLQPYLRIWAPARRLLHGRAAPALPLAKLVEMKKTSNPRPTSGPFSDRSPFLLGGDGHHRGLLCMSQPYGPAACCGSARSAGTGGWDRLPRSATRAPGDCLIHLHTQKNIEPSVDRAPQQVDRCGARPHARNVNWPEPKRITRHTKATANVNDFGLCPSVQGLGSAYPSSARGTAGGPAHTGGEYRWALQLPAASWCPLQLPSVQ